MKSVNCIHDLKIPTHYKAFLRTLLTAMQDDSRIDQILLFGSCACGNVRKGSDIDIAIITKEQLDLNEELSFYDYLIDIDPKDYIPNDMIIMSRKQYDEHKYSSGYVQKYIYRDGVDLRESVRRSM